MLIHESYYGNKLGLPATCFMMLYNRLHLNSSKSGILKFPQNLLKCFLVNLDLNKHLLCMSFHYLSNHVGSKSWHFCIFDISCTSILNTLCSIVPCHQRCYRQLCHSKHYETVYLCWPFQKLNSPLYTLRFLSYNGS